MGGPGAVDQIVASRYRLREMIGRGGMGCVWKAEHVSLRTPVAIKLLRPEVAEREEWRSRFLREAQAAAELRSRHVVHILDHGIDDGVPYLAMEYLHGQSLQARLKSGGALSPEETAVVMRGILRAISRAHRAGIVHRDLKPDNVFLADDEDSSDPWVVKVLDFGIAKLVDERSGESDVATSTGVVLGTPYYMSPEQTMGVKDLDARSDLWSLAAIAFECLTGKRAFEADAIGRVISKICFEPVPVPSKVAKVPDGFDAWFARASQREPKDRFPTASAFAAALAEVLSPGQRWLDTRSDERTSTPSGPQTAGTSALEDAPTELPAGPAGITGQTASRTVTPEERVLQRRAAGGGRHAWIAAAVLTAAGVVGVGYLSTGSGADEPAGAHSTPAASPARAPEGASAPTTAASTAEPGAAPGPSVVPSAPAASASAVASASAPLAGSASAPRPPPAAPRRPAPPPPATSVNLGI